MSEREEQWLKRQQVLADFGELVIRSHDLDEVLIQACRLVGEALGTGCAKVLEIQEDRHELLVRASVGWAAGVVGAVRLKMSDRSSETYAIEAAAPVIMQDIAAETRFDIPEFMKKAGVVALINVPIFVPGKRPYGILQVDDTKPRDFGDDEIQFLRTYAMILGPVIDRLHLLEERTEIQRSLRSSEARHGLLIERWAQSIWETNAEGVVVTDSPSWRAFTGQAEEEWLGYGWLDAIHPDDRAYAELQWREAVALCGEVDAEFRLRNSDGGWRWTNVRASPIKDDDGVIQKWIGMNVDIDARKRAEATLYEGEKRQAFLLKLSDTLRAIPDDAIVTQAFEMLSDELQLDLCYAVSVSPDEDRADVIYQLRRRGDMPGVPAVIQLSDYPQAFVEWQERTLVSEDMASDPALTEVDRQNVAAMRFAALIAAPVRRGVGHPIWSIVAVMARPRHWTASEVVLVEETAERTWVAVEQARTQAILRKSEERQAFLLKLSDALGPLVDAAEIQATTTRLLGEHLRVDRSMYAEVTGEPGAETGTIRGQFLRRALAGVPATKPFPNHFTFETFGTEVMARRYSGEGLAVADVNADPGFDVADRAAWAAVGVQAAIVAPLVKGGRLVAELGVHSETPRVWTDTEIALVHEVGERTWAAAERARAEAALRESEERYRSLFESMDEAYAVVDVLKDEAGNWVDFRFVEVNPAFLAHTTMPWPVGKTATELLGTPNPRWTQLYGQALDTGKAIRVEESEPALNRTFDLNIFALDRDRDRVAVLFTDITARKRVEAALRESEQWLQTLMMGVPQLVWRAADPGRWTWASPQWTEFTGQSEVESHGWGWLAAVHPDDREAVEARWASAIERGEFHSDYRICHHVEDHYRWFQTRATPLRDEHGEIIEWLGTSTDVDDLRRLQERQQVLLAELQHRVRNILAVTRAIISRSDDGERSTDDYVAHLQGRIGALARTQVLLTRTAGTKIDLESLIRDEIVAQAASQDRISLTGEDVAISPKTAEVLTLAIHELATNATKYGAFSRASGRLDVSWQVEARDGSQWLVILWREHGVPIVDAVPRREGFGTELIRRRIPYELKGYGSVELRPGGLAARIEFPLVDGESILQTDAGGR